MDRPESQAKAWYVSAEKLERSLGEPASEPSRPMKQAAGTRVPVMRRCCLTNSVRRPDPDPHGRFFAAPSRHRHIPAPASGRLVVLLPTPMAEIRDTNRPRRRYPAHWTAVCAPNCRIFSRGLQLNPALGSLGAESTMFGNAPFRAMNWPNGVRRAWNHNPQHW